MKKFVHAWKISDKEKLKWRKEQKIWCATARTRFHASSQNSVENPFVQIVLLRRLGKYIHMFQYMYRSYQKFRARAKLSRGRICKISSSPKARGKCATANIQKGATQLMRFMFGIRDQSVYVRLLLSVFRDGVVSANNSNPSPSSNHPYRILTETRA